MKNALKNSMIYRGTLYLKFLWESSFLKKLLFKINYIYCFSLTYKGIIHYLETKSTAKDTLTYRLLSRIGKAFDRMLVSIIAVFKKYYSHSLICSLFKDLSKSFRSSGMRLAAYFFAAFILSYNLGVLVSGKMNSRLIIYDLVLVALSGTILLLLKSWPERLKNSLMYRVCKYLWE